MQPLTELFTTVLKTVYDNAVTWITTNGTNVLNHLTRTDNPHSVTKAQVGLGNVDNTSDANKPVSTATQAALDDKQDKLVSGTSLKTVGGNSLLGSGDIPFPSGSGTSVPISTHVEDGFRISEFADRFEYSAKIQYTTIGAGTGGNRYNTVTTSYRLPEGVSLNDADDVQLSFINHNRTLDITVFDDSNRWIRVGIFNNYSPNSGSSTKLAIFIKVTNYK